MTDWWRDAPRPSGPIRVDGGIKARSQRGDIGRSWWSRRFIEVLESLGLGGRLDRGRRYARTGQVLSMTVSTSIVMAQVQGSRPEPYKVRIGVKAFTGAEWSTVERAMASQALYAAKLLAGEMPTDIETLFAELGLQLFPQSLDEISMDCSCPDWEVPCKHLAAVSYLLAESFDQDPFQILAWRGRSRQPLLERLHDLRGRTVAGPVGPVGAEPEVPVDDTPPLTDCLDTFWVVGSTAVSRAPVPDLAPDAVLDTLQPLDLSVRGTPVVDALRQAYRAMADPTAGAG